MAFLLIITAGLCIVYLGLLVMLPLFFSQTGAPISKKSFLSVGLISLLSVVGYLVTFVVPDPEVANRILHGFGGGCMAFLTCFLAFKDSGVRVPVAVFLVFSLMAVSTLGVANEVWEFFLQESFNLTFATGINDTWYDLVSNTVGAFIAGLLLIPLILKNISSEKTVN